MKTQYEVSVIWIIWLLLGLYLVIVHYLMIKSEDEYRLLSILVKSDGVMICIAITVVKLIELIRLRLFDPIGRLMLILVIYVIVYGLRAGPYMLVSFVQPFARNIVIHFLSLFLLIELCIFYAQMRIDKKS